MIMECIELPLLNIETSNLGFYFLDTYYKSLKLRKGLCSLSFLIYVLADYIGIPLTPALKILSLLALLVRKIHRCD